MEGVIKQLKDFRIADFVESGAYLLVSVRGMDFVIFV